MTNSIILENLNSDSLKELIKEAVRNELAAMQSKKETAFLTRNELAKRLHISLPTVDKGIKTGKLKAYRINGRILFKEDEINLTEIPTRKHF